MKPPVRALTLALIVGLSATGHGQTLDPLNALERYLGTWVYEGDGNGARVTCRSERRWIANRSFIESRRECTTGTGPISQVEIFGFDPRRGIYVYWGFNGRIPSTYVAATMDDAVVWSGEQASGSNRCSETFAPDRRSSTAQCEVSSDSGQTWRRVSGGSSKRVD